MNDTYSAAPAAGEKSAATPQFRLLAIIACLYLVQGLPVGLAFQAYPVLLRDGGASLDLISLVPLASLPWVFKFFWAAMVENRWYRPLGRRKSWILPMQTLLALSLAGMAFLPFTAENAAALLGWVALASLARATQDIATDGLASERLHGSGIAHINTLQVAGFMIGMLIGGPATLVGIGLFGHAATLSVLAVLVLLCGVPVALWREPEPPQARTQTQTISAPKASLRAFFRREHALRMLALGIFATMGGAVVFGLAKLILIDAGWPLDAVGSMSGTAHSLTILFGCGVAALLLQRIGHWNTLILGSSLTLASSALWIPLAMSPEEYATPSLVWPLAVCGGLGIGIATVASYTALMRFAQLGAQPGTDFSVFQGTQTLGEIVVSSVATAIAAQAGYSVALTVGATAALVSVLMTLSVRKTPVLVPRPLPG